MYVGTRILAHSSHITKPLYLCLLSRSSPHVPMEGTGFLTGDAVEYVPKARALDKKLRLQSELRRALLVMMVMFLVYR